MQKFLTSFGKSNSDFKHLMQLFKPQRLMFWMAALKKSHPPHVSVYLLIKFIDNAFCPFQMQVPDFGWAVYICQLDAHLAHQEAVVFITPLYAITVHIIGLFWKNNYFRFSESEHRNSVAFYLIILKPFPVQMTGS